MNKIVIILVSAIVVLLAILFFQYLSIPAHASFGCYGYCHPHYTPSPTPQPTVEPSQSPSPTNNPCVSEYGEIKVAYEFEFPCPTDRPTPTPEPVANHTDSFSATNAPHFDCADIEFVPTILGFNRLSPTSVNINWSKTDPIDDYRVFYGLSKDNLPWNVGVENTHEVTLNDLPANKSIWVQVFGTDGHCLGKGSQAIDP